MPTISWPMKLQSNSNLAAFELQALCTYTSSNNVKQFEIKMKIVQ